jgi:hypothetical protein
VTSGVDEREGIHVNRDIVLKVEKMTGRAFA